MPNAIAYLVLFSWPLVAFMLFRTMPVGRAIAWTILGGYLFLPLRTGFDFPLLPPIDKTLVPAVSALVFAILAQRSAGQEPQAAPKPWGRALFLGLFGLLVITPFITVLTNSDPVVAGPLVIPGLRLYDSFSILNELFVTLIPFLLARRFLADSAAQADLLKVFVLAGIGYSLLALYEVRMSPQLNVNVYGFFPHSFIQHIRGGGFRPVVFLHHGLWLAIFLGTTVLAAAALWRVRRGTVGAGRWLLAAFWLLVVLVLARSLGALLIVVLLLPVILLAGARFQLLLAALVAMVVLLYPIVRGAGVVPISYFVAAIEAVAPDRAQSFSFRLENEVMLLDRANLKPLAGWGSWGRPRIYDSNTGRDLSVTDGAWIILLGSDGWLGYFGRFGLLTLPVILLWCRRRSLEPDAATSGLALMLAGCLIDLVPNATLTPVTWLLAGALAGRVQMHTDRPLAAGESEPSPELARRFTRGHPASPPRWVRVKREARQQR